MFLLLMATTESQATEPDWQVLPDTCVVDKPGDLCTMSLTISARSLPNDTYCLYLADQKLECWQTIKQSFQTTIRYGQNSRLALVNSRDYVVLSADLKIKTLQSPQGRRRVRSPWSIF
ncbi:DUF3019 domain-containing protein [Neptunicella sp. SCSIO 80796]|uniref:DUF3019 domain-containing protein n=1 Tax=Neptunicella plasticusilytica TaxID=3117012 RepID=UPI003A4DA47A